ncbi:MAG: hypothetical protein KC618_06375 [Candidatus Omnitrophica bacterium]|nr:hypothetical protein [Candidatus Omnitrophota bacterium]
MKLPTIIKTTFVVTSLALVYIHLQMQIIDLAYQGKDKEQKIRYLIEENGSITYSILTYKSAHNLGVKMLAENSDMRFLDSDSIVSITASEDVFEQQPTNQQIEPPKKSTSLLSFLSFGSQAEARPQP